MSSPRVSNQYIFELIERRFDRLEKLFNERSTLVDTRFESRCAFVDNRFEVMEKEVTVLKAVKERLLFIWAIITAVTSVTFGFLGDFIKRKLGFSEA